MKILWLCNIVLPELAYEFGVPKSNIGGWLTGAWNELKKCELLELGICVPIKNLSLMKDGTFDCFTYYSFPMISGESNTTIQAQVSRFSEVLSDFRPDIIHIWGTEFEHSYSMVKACEKLGMLDKVVVNIQGLLTYYERLYELGLPDDVVENNTSGLSIRDGKIDFKRRASYEQALLEKVMYVSGRTDWDYACVKNLNRNIKYFYCGEILRASFYKSRKWNKIDCVKHSIFISQAFYPIKGFHLILEEIKNLTTVYPDLVVRVAGNNLSIEENGFSEYIKKRIRDLNISSNIVFLGKLTEEEMIIEYLNCNAFVSASLIENSSNSVCEAMILGVPVVSSFVGGMASVIEHGVSGFLYPLNEPYMMTSYIIKIFEDDKIMNLSEAEIQKAFAYNNRTNVKNDILKMYKMIQS